MSPWNLDLVRVLPEVEGVVTTHAEAGFDLGVRGGVAAAAEISRGGVVSRFCAAFRSELDSDADLPYMVLYATTLVANGDTEASARWHRAGSTEGRAERVVDIFFD